MLSPDEIYDILSLRCAVFTVEQKILCQDPDDLDKKALHLWASKDELPLSYCRILPAKTRFEEPSIGRVCTAIESRGKGLARELMTRAISLCNEHYGEQTISLSSQVYLQDFYKSLGFRCVSQPYEEEGIAHVHMRNTA